MKSLKTFGLTSCPGRLDPGDQVAAGSTSCDHPKICHFGIRIILRRKQFKNHRYRKSILPPLPLFAQRRDTHFSLWKCPLCHAPAPPGREGKRDSSPETGFSTWDEFVWVDLTKRALIFINFFRIFPNHFPIIYLPLLKVVKSQCFSGFCIFTVNSCACKY